ncbi:MAG: glycoside hydrolase family 99-like domain-containing protein [Bdellovibrionota bacterium]
MEFLTSPFGLGSQLITAELGVLFLLAVVVAVRRARGDSLQRTMGLLHAVLALAFLLSHALTTGRPVLAVGLTPPGSLLTRMLNLAISPSFRRLLEPSLILLYVTLAGAALVADKKAPRRFFVSAALLLGAIVAVESLSLHPAALALLDRPQKRELAVFIHYALTQALMTVLLAVFLREARSKESGEIHPGSRRRLAAALVGATVCFISAPFLVIALLNPRPTTLVGVHYYSWFPENWVAGYIGEKLEPPVLPALGRYNSADPQVMTEQLNWIECAGINLLILDWWSRNPAVRKRIDQEIEFLGQHPQTSFCLQYESLDLKSVADHSPENEPANVVYMSAERTERLKKDWERIARVYMSKPGYLRINNRPVLFLYATRHLVGPVAAAVEAAREQVRKSTGEELYLVADEAYYHVMNYRSSRGTYLMPELKPNWSRMTAFDAVTCYNPYDASRREHSGSKGFDTYLRDVTELYYAYKSYASTSGLEFIPGVLPGYNDRGVRLAENHFVIPREIEGKNVFELTLNRLVRTFIDENQPFFAITSWNEWNEGTQIEPARSSPMTDEDVSGRDEYTAGESYRGYGEEYLDKLANFLKSL